MMKVQHGESLRTDGGQYYHTYVNIPSYIRNEMRLASGKTVFIALVNRSEVEIRRIRRHADDFAVKLHESVTRKYKGEIYTAMRLTLPNRLVDMMNIMKNSEADFVYTGARCFVKFKNPDPK